MALLDRHETIKEFIAGGISEQHAELITKAISNRESNLVTKHDLDLAVNKLETDLTRVQSDVTGLKTELAEFRADVTGLKTELAEFRAEMRTDANWTKAIGVAMLVLLFKVAFF